MSETATPQPDLIGRDAEMARLREHLDKAIAGKGSTVLISGEPGIGKTRLLEEFMRHASFRDITILSGTALSTSGHPFLVFLKALEGVTSEPIFEYQEQTSFAEIFVVNKAGLLVAKASSETEGLDADIFAGMLSAVQDFVRDSFDRFGGNNAGLGRLEYGDLKILIEHGQHVFLTAVIRSQEHPDMRDAVRRAIRDIEERFGQMFENWSGRISDIEPVQQSVNNLAGARFMVRKDIEGVKLENERLKIADKVLATLTSISEKQGVLLVLEDMHWADTSSLFVVQYLARNINCLKVIMLGTSRTEQSPQTERAVKAMKADDLVAEIALKKMDEHEIFSLIDARYSPNNFPQDFREQLFATCVGNPFFIIELLKQMLADGHINNVDGTFALVRKDYTVPTTIEEVVQRRLDTLEPDAMALAEYASCAGRAFETGMLDSLSSIQNLESAFGKLRAAEIVERHNGTTEFCHALFQDTIYKGISPRWRAMHHKSIGEYYETTYNDKPDEVLYELARHFALSTEHRKGFDYCTKAGEKAERAYAFEQAISYWGIAMDALSHLRGDVDVKKVELREKLGDLWVAAGAYGRAIEEFGIALAEQKDNLAKARLHRKRAGVFERKSDYADAFKEILIGKQFVDGTELEHWCLVHQCAGVHARKGEHDEAITICETLLPELERFEGSERDQGRALSLLGFAYLRNGHQDKAVDCFRRSLSVLEKAEDISGMANVHNNLGILHYNQGEYENARSAYDDGLKLYERLKDQSGMALLYNNIALTYWTSGSWDIAIELCEKSLRIRERIGDKTGIAMSLVNLGAAYLEMGDMDKAFEYFSRNLAIVEQTEDRRGVALVCSNIGMIMREKGDFQSSETWYTRSIETARKWKVKDYLVEGLFGIMELYIAMEKFSEAQALDGEIMKAMKEAGLKLYEYQHLCLLGMLHAGLRELDNAEEEFSEAYTGLVEMKAETDAAKIRYEWGKMLITGDQGRMTRGREMLAQVRTVFETHGMHLWQVKCEKALGETD